MCWRLKTLLLFTLLVCLGGVRLVAAWKGFANYHDPANPGKCTISETIIISPGEKVRSPDSCAEIHCSNENGAAMIIGCAGSRNLKHCEWRGYMNKTADYPACCDRYLKCVSGVIHFFNIR